MKSAAEGELAQKKLQYDCFTDLGKSIPLADERDGLKSKSQKYVQTSFMDGP